MLVGSQQVCFYVSCLGDTVKEMVLGVVGTFKDHRSLARTLQDSEHIAQKLGLIIMCVILFILFVSEMPSFEKSARAAN